VLRLARILNFMKLNLDNGKYIAADPTPENLGINNPGDRMETSRRLLSQFLDDGKIRGVTPEGEVFEHLISQNLANTFRTGLAAVELRGSQ